MTNLELKARVPSIELSLERARGSGAEYAGMLIQVDTYFNVSQGRLKLREAEGGLAELIFYERSEVESERWSNYQKTAVADPDSLKLLLKDALGLRAVVRKQRHLFLLPGARIHIDEVEDLGSFLEFEIAEAGPGECRRRMKSLRQVFEIQEESVIRSSYVDLLLEKKILP